MNQLLEIVTGKFTNAAKSEKGIHFSFTLSKYKLEKIKRFLKTGKLK